MTSDVIVTGRKYQYRFATGRKLILFKHILLSSISVNNRVIVIENRQKNFQLQLRLSTFENLQLQLQQNRVINCNFVNYNYNFSKPDLDGVKMAIFLKKITKIAQRLGLGGSAYNTLELHQLAQHIVQLRDCFFKQKNKLLI